MQKRNSYAKLGLAIASIALALLTLMPGDRLLGSLGLAGCLACGDLGTLDAIHNSLLFVPVGFLLLRVLQNPMRAAGAAALASLGIEGLQLMLLPSRDPAILDWLMNTAGGGVGVLLVVGWRWLRSADRLPAAPLMAAAALVPLAGLAASAILLRPAPVPTSTLFGQWAPRRPNFEPRAGRVVSLEVGSVAVPHGFVPDQDGLRSAWNHGARARLRIQEPVAPSARPILLARLVAVDDEVFLLAARADALLTRVRLVASNLGLRPLIWQVRGVRGTGPFVVEAGLGSQGIVMGTEAETGRGLRFVALDATLGWALLLPFELALGDWHHGISGLWTAVLFLPLGLFSGWRGHRHRGMAAGAAACVLVAGLGGLPLALHSAPTHWISWLGGAAGLAAGWRAGIRVLRVPA